MNPFHSIWWRVCDDGRSVVRYLAGRNRKLAVWGVLSRWALHLLAGNPLHVAAALVSAACAVLLPGPLALSVLVVLVAALALFEIWFQWMLIERRGSWMHGWRLWFRVRRAIPAEWAESAVKTKGVKSVVGGERRMSAQLRPVADHPKVAWLPRIEWPVVSAWVGHPPGRTMSAAIDFQKTLAANILRVDNLEFDFERERDSVGRIIVTFVDVLSVPVAPERSRVDALDGYVAPAEPAASDAVDSPPADREPVHLRLVRDEVA